MTGRVESKVKRRRVAGYVRVSTDKDEQFTSFQAQTDYYTQYIQSNPAWEFVKVYTDEGITGTSTWLALIDTVLVKPDGKLVFRFANGMVVDR